MMLACVAMPLTSCEDEPQNETEEQHDPISDEDQTAIAGYDALEYLQSCIVVVDKNGDVERRVYGKPLDASQPTVISIPVKDLAMAEQIFLGWVAPEKEATKAEGGYDYNLTDKDGNNQGSVSFRAVKDEAGVIAQMSVTAETDLKQVSEVKFISADLWPENDEIAKYEAGKTYMLNDNVWQWVRKTSSLRDPKYYVTCENKDIEFYCIQGNDNEKEAILVWLCPDVNETDKHPVPGLYVNHDYDDVDYDVYTKLPSVAEAHKVLKFHNENYDAWQTMLKTMDAKGYLWSAQSGISTTGNSEFLLNDYDTNTIRIKCLDLDNKVGKICNVWATSWFKYRYMHIRIFPPLPN